MRKNHLRLSLTDDGEHLENTLQPFKSDIRNSTVSTYTAADDEINNDDVPKFSGRTIYTPPEYFPLFQVCVLFFASLTGALPLTSLFPYVAFMVVDMGAAPDVDRAGFVSGYVASAFMFGRLLSSFYWGHVADLIGRKPVIYISCIAIAVFSISFGLSINIWMALISRFLLGFLNPLSSLTKTLISEICAKKHQPMGMAVAAGSWSVGLVVGPAVGGSLARSAVLYPGTILDNPMTRQFPYLLPNAVTALFGLISFVLINLYLPETMAPIPQDDSNSRRMRSAASEQYLTEEGCANEKPSNKALEPAGAFTAILKNASELIADTKVRTVSFAYFSISLSAIIYDECLPLWALSSRDKGGLDMTSAMIGTATSITGIPMLLFSFIIFPIVNKRFGSVACFRYAQFVCNIFALLTVVMAAVGGLTGNTTIPVLILMASGEKSFACISFTATFLLINDSVSPERRGSVNGFVMTIGGLAKTLGPVLGASLYAWSINSGIHTPPFNYIFVFMCCFLIGVLSLFIRFHSSEEGKKREDGEEDGVIINDNSTDKSVNAMTTIELHKYKEYYPPTTDNNDNSNDQSDESINSNNGYHPTLLNGGVHRLRDYYRKICNTITRTTRGHRRQYTGVGNYDNSNSSNTASTATNNGDVESGTKKVSVLITLSPLHKHSSDGIVWTYLTENKNTQDITNYDNFDEEDVAISY